ncbi:MAG: HD domain-containing protein [Erysipelotrichia bacterium]|nr:HD domain-containing protein [Erysipelotrichia bacterium]
MSEKTSVLLSSFLEWLNVPARWQKSFLARLGLFFVAMVLILVIDPTGFTPDVMEGKPAPKTIRCPRAISFVDELKTAELRALEMEKIQPVYTPIEQAEEKMLERYDQQLYTLTLFYDEFKKLSPSEPSQNLIASYFPADALLEPEKLVQLRTLRISQIEKLKTVSRRILVNLSQKVISSQNLEMIRLEVRTLVEAYPESAAFKQIMTSMIRNAIMINAIEDDKLTRQRREAAARSIQPVKRTFQKGQKIVEEGLIVTSDDYFVMKKIASQLKKNKVLALMGNLLLTILIVVISLVFLRLEDKNVIDNVENYKLLAVIFLATLALAKTAYALGVAFDKPYLSILLTPLPTVALLMTMLLDCSLAMFHIFLLGLMMFVVAESNVRFVVISLFGAIAGILAWRSATRSSDLRSLIGTSGLKIGLASGISVLAFLLLDSESFATMDFRQILTYTGFGFLNGILSGILANGVLPYMESFFSLATTSRLLELTDLSQPLLRKLAEEAPGTYQHSVAVATLAEAAANGIGADPLLTKISAYFHDIGKIRRPMYFAENQADENRHDQVTPYMSSLILIGHIRDSIDLGREYGLPERVLAILSQHHGTTLISYFYEEAKKLKDGEEVNQERFRYPGPKPQTKEAAILMLADSVEAAARTLPQHTHSKIEGLVEKIIEHKLNDENQLDESDLTLKDIEKIEQIFVRALTSMYHGRIDYPGKLSNQPKGASDGSVDQ